MTLLSHTLFILFLSSPVVAHFAGDTVARGLRVGAVLSRDTIKDFKQKFGIKEDPAFSPNDSTFW